MPPHRSGSRLSTRNIRAPAQDNRRLFPTLSACDTQPQQTPSASYVPSPRPPTSSTPNRHEARNGLRPNPPQKANTVATRWVANGEIARPEDVSQLAWMRIMGTESVAYHRRTVLERGDDYPGMALAYHASRGETPMRWSGAGAETLDLNGTVSPPAGPCRGGGRTGGPDRPGRYRERRPLGPGRRRA